MRKFKFSFGFKDKLSELVFEGAALGFFTALLIKDVYEKKWWGVAIDIALVVWSYVNARKITKQLRSNTDDSQTN